MSWQQYIDESLLGTKNIDQAAIYSVDNMGKWAGSPGFEVSAAELADFVKAYGDSAEPKSIQGSGFHVAGVKYITVKADDRSIYGMKGKEGIIAVRGKQAMIVAHYPATVAAGNAATVVENLVDYLIKSGY